MTSAAAADEAEEEGADEAYIVVLVVGDERRAAETKWTGPSRTLEADAGVWTTGPPTPHLLLVVAHPLHLARRRRQLLEVLGPGLNPRHELRPAHRLTPPCLLAVQHEVQQLSRVLVDVIREVVETFLHFCGVLRWAFFLKINSHSYSIRVNPLQFHSQSTP